MFRRDSNRFEKCKKIGQRKLSECIRCKKQTAHFKGKMFFQSVSFMLLLLLSLTGVSYAFKSYNHENITKDSLAAYEYSGKSYKFTQKVIDEIVEHNRATDDGSGEGEFFTESAHCDNETIPACTKRLIDFKKDIVTSIQSKDYANARLKLGKALHTLQDYYSHSNWVDGLNKPTFNHNLGLSQEEVAAEGEKTCTKVHDPDYNISEEGKIWKFSDFGLKKQTTEYFTEFLDAMPPKHGKCDHGWFADSGVAKDEDPYKATVLLGGTNEKYKAYRSAIFTNAHNQAIAATDDYLKQVFTALSAGGVTDEQIRTFMQGDKMIGFVVDDTGSMEGTIDEVKTIINGIITKVTASPDTAPNKYLLQTFNDPTVPASPTIYDTPSDLLAAVYKITVDGGGDCPELSMKGLSNAIAAAYENTTLYSFTDTDSKDSYLMDGVVKQANDKHITISAKINGKCSMSSSSSMTDSGQVTPNTLTHRPLSVNPMAAVTSDSIDPTYVYVTSQTGGQVFTKSDDATAVLNAIEPSLTGTPQFILKVQADLNNSSKDYTFPVDTSINRLIFSVVVNGTGNVVISRPDGSIVTAGDSGVTYTTSGSGIVFVSVANPAIGMWKLDISITGEGSYDAIVYGNSSINFSIFAVVEIRGAPGDSGLFPIDGMPISGKTVKAIAKVFGTYGSVNFELHSLSGDMLQTINLKAGNSYDAPDNLAGSFSLPGEPFMVYAVGTDTAGKNFMRVFANVFKAQTIAITPPKMAYHASVMANSAKQYIKTGATSPDITGLIEGIQNLNMPIDLVPGVNTITYTVTNTGTDDSFTIKATDTNGYVSNVTPGVLTLSKNSSSKVVVTLNVPASVSDSSQDLLTATVRSNTDSSINNTSTVAATIFPEGKIYALTVTKAGNGSGTITASTGTLTWNDNTGTATYSSGTSVTLTATPTQESKFGGWTGCDSTSGNQCTVAMSSNMSVSVSFTQGVCLLCRIPRMDFNGNGKSDILWRSISNGMIYTWLMNGINIASGGSPATLGDEWQIESMGDFNGDGTTDIVWRNTSTGMVYIWLMGGATLTGGGSPATLGHEWQIESIGDFNGDGRSDIMWRNTENGQVYTWFMNGASIAGGASPSAISQPSSVDSDWQVVSSGDFDGDGKSDVLWINTSTGMTYIWFMNGTGGGSPGTVDANWQIACVSDFNGDGKTDILWRNISTGMVYIWLMNGATIADSGSPGTVGLEWQIVNVGDFNGDGRSDLLWRNSDNDMVYTWLMNATQITDGDLTAKAGTQWQIISVGDFNGDGKRDLVWRNSATGEICIWLMDGTQLSLGGLPAVLGTEWQIQ